MENSISVPIAASQECDSFQVEVEHPIGYIEATLGDFEGSKCVLLCPQIKVVDMTSSTERIVLDSNGLFNPQEDEVTITRQWFSPECRKYGILFDPLRGTYSRKYLYENGTN